MQELLLINPRKRRASKRRSNPSAAQKRARAAFGRAAKARSRVRRRNPVASLALANPRKRRAVARRRNPIRARSRRRNPIMGGGSFIKTAVGMLQESAIGAAGSIAVDAVFAQVKPMLPASINSGNAYTGVKALGTVALGLIARRFLGSKAMVAAQGALTVQLAGVMRPYAASMGVPLGYLTPAYTLSNAASGKPIAVSQMSGLRGRGLRAVVSNGSRVVSIGGASNMLSGLNRHPGKFGDSGASSGGGYLRGIGEMRGVAGIYP